MRRSRLVLVLAGLGAFGLAGAPPVTAQQIPVRLGGSTSSFVNLPFDVPLEVDLSARSEKLGSFALTLKWNPAVLQFISGDDGNFGSLVGKGDSTQYGLLRLTGVNPAGVGGKVVLGVAHFKPVAAAADTFRLDVTELYAAGTFADLLPSAVWSNRAYCNAVGRFGDIDGDQAANSRDALLALASAVGTAVPGNPAMGDVDGDGTTSARDALIILSNAVGLDVSAFRVLLVAPGSCAAPARPALAVLPGSVTFDVGQTTPFLAVASDSTGAGLAVTDVFWKSSNDQVATVSPKGVVSAVGLGTATITAVRQGGASATAPVTVLARHTHWVDALANPDSVSQLGAPELPFSNIPAALAYARAGDTVMVRPGRYQDTVVIGKPVVLMGDTSGGKPRPLLSGRAYYDLGVVVNAHGRVELQQLRIDTLAQGVDVWHADTLLVRGVEFRSAASAYYTSLYVESAGAVYVERSSFFGPATSSYSYNTAIAVYGAAVVRIDSTDIAEYAGDGVDLFGVDSVVVQGSTIQHNYGYGVFATPYGYALARAAGAPPQSAAAASLSPTIAAVFSGNALRQNTSIQVYLEASRGAHFDHNRVLSGAAGGVQVYGTDTTADVTFLGDSITTGSYGYPIYLSLYDTLSVDSTVVVANGAYASYLSGGRLARVRHSQFLDVTSGAMDVYSSPFDTTHVLLRNVRFQGPAKGICDRCADMIYGDTLSLDADSIAMTNMEYGFDLSYSRAVVNHATFENYSEGLRAACGYLSAANSSFNDGSYGIEGSGCGASDSIVLTNSLMSHATYGVYASSVAATVVLGSHFTDSYYALYHNCGQLRVAGDTATSGYYGVDASGCSAADSLAVDSSSFAGFEYAVSLYGGGRQWVRKSVFTDDVYGVEAESAPVVLQGNQVIRPQYTGLYHYWSGADTSTVQILNNTITCDAIGATSATAIDAEHPSSPTQAVYLVQGNSIGNCDEGIYLTGGWQAVARGNAVTMPGAGQGYRGIYLDADTSAVAVGNTVSGPGPRGSVYLTSSPKAVADSNLVSGGAGAGLYLSGPFDSLHVRDNTVSGLAYGSGAIAPSAAIRLDGGTFTGNFMAEIRRNRVTGTTNGIVLNRSASDTLTIRVDSNTVRDADSVGVLVSYYSYARLLYNAIDSSGLDGVRIYNSYRSGPAAQVNNNNFTRNQHFGVNNLAASYVVDATNNYWGSATGPACDTICGSGDSVSTAVSFVPYSSTPISTFTPAPPLVAASLAAPTLFASTPATTVRRVSQAQPAPAVSGRPQPAVAQAPATPAIPQLPALTVTNRVTQRAAAQAAARVLRLQQRAALQAQLGQQLQARRAAREQAHAARLQAESARRAQPGARRAPGPAGRTQ